MNWKVLTILLGAAIILRVFLVSHLSVPFAYDMGRDLLWAKDIAFYGIPTLIGPAASIWGVYFPPFWFYFLSIPLLLANGHPLSAVYVTALSILATALFSYLFFRKLSSLFAITLFIIILFNAKLVNISLFAFHANLLPFLTLLSIYFIFLAVVKSPSFFPISLFIVSLMYAADPAPAAAFTFVPIFAYFAFKLYRRGFIKILLLSILAYLIPLSPLILFELRNNFIQTKSLLAYFHGENPSLSGSLPLAERIINRLSVYFDFFKSGFAGDNLPIAIILPILTITGLYFFSRQKERMTGLVTLFKITLASLIIPFLVFTLLFNVEVKNWYLYGAAVPIAIILACAFYGLINGLRSKTVFVIITSVFLLVNLLPYAQNEKAAASRRDPATLANQLQVIDAIYQDPKDKPFAVYVYTPAIYDYHYQYLFWWQGVRHKKGLPQDFAYLPNQPDYVRNKQVYAPLNQPKADVIYLIIEKGAENEFYTQKQWLQNFKDYQLIWQKDINGAILLQKRLR